MPPERERWTKEIGLGIGSEASSWIKAYGDWIDGSWSGDWGDKIKEMAEEKEVELKPWEEEEIHQEMMKGLIKRFGAEKIEGLMVKWKQEAVEEIRERFDSLKKEKEEKK